LSDAPPLRIGSFEDLKEGLRSPDDGTRWGVLRAISSAPAKAASYGPVDELLLPMWRAAEGLERVMCLGALLPFPYPELFLEEFFATSHPETLLMLAHRLAQEPGPWLVPRLGERFLTETLPRRQLLLANMLSAQQHLPLAVRLRCAVLAAVDTALPPWTPDAAPAWIRELPAAQALLERLGWPAYEGLLEHELPAGSRPWLAEWGLRLDDPRGVQKLEPRAALAILRGHPEHWDRFPIAAWGQQPDLRTLAWQCGAPLPPVLEAEPALIARWPEAEELAELLDHPDWRIRAAAVDRLVTLGADVAREPASEAGQLALVQLRERLLQRP
jgi:hypothetical protein